MRLIGAFATASAATAATFAHQRTAIPIGGPAAKIEPGRTNLGGQSAGRILPASHPPPRSAPASNRHSAPLSRPRIRPAISCLGAFWTPAARARGRVRHAGVQKPAQTRKLASLGPVAALARNRTENGTG